MEVFEVSSDNLKSQHYDTIMLLQCCKLKTEQNENIEEWMGHLRIKAVECDCKEKDTMLKEQFIHSINYNDILTEILRAHCNQNDKLSQQ